MAAKRSPSRQKLINAALELFASQGITETTTRQIAERAGVNEVTLFRQFGNKHGLLLSAIEETEVFSTLARTLAQEASRVNSLEQALRDYVDARLQALEAMPEFVRSLVGEAGQYPTENRQSLGRELTQANRFVAQYLTTAMKQGPLQTRVPAEKFASLLNSLLLGYAVLEFTSEFHQLWDDRDDFLDYVVNLFLDGAVHPIAEAPGVTPTSERTLSLSQELPGQALPVQELPVQELPTQDISAQNLPGLDPPAATVSDLPTNQVHAILKQSKTLGPQEFALIYVLFAAGLSALEATQLQRHHYQNHHNQAVLQIPQEPSRFVPLNQWILGKRYGSSQKNPLSQWLKGRKDNHPALFVSLPEDSTDSSSEQAMTPAEMEACWQRCSEAVAIAASLTPSASNSPLSPTIDQAQQTWRVDMLMRGMTPESLSLLTGLTSKQLAPYIHRSRVKKALAEAMNLDGKTGDRKRMNSSE